MNNNMVSGVQNEKVVSGKLSNPQNEEITNMKELENNTEQLS